jgi:hypothetical protein
MRKTETRRIVWRAALASTAMSWALTACGGMAGPSLAANVSARGTQAQYQPVNYANAAKPGPRIIVLNGEIKSNNATFLQRMSPNNIADFGELELTRANFTVLERSKLGPLMREIELAYSMGDREMARRAFQKGKLATTRWVVEFDVLKVEQVVAAAHGFDGRAAGDLIGAFTGGSKLGQAAGITTGSIQADESAKVWNVGIRYKILDANSTEQVANGYFEEKMEDGTQYASVAGVSTGSGDTLSLDSLVQRLVQKSVAEIDAKYK